MADRSPPPPHTRRADNRVTDRSTERDYRNLLQALADAEGLLPVLARLLPEPSSIGPATGTIGRHAPESSEPWQAEAADAYWRIWFGARKLADQLRHIAGLPPRIWGYGETSAALAAVADLATIVPPHVLLSARVRVERWVTAARRIRDIDETDAWVPLPRPPGWPAPACPYCHTLSLRMAKGREEVRCFYPGCVDFDGNPTKARMESGRFTDSGSLVFGDGTIVAYREGYEQPDEYTA